MEPLAQLAVALAAALQSAFPTVTYAAADHAVTALWEPEPSIASEAVTLNDPKIWVVDYAEELMADRGCGDEEFSLLIVIQQKLVPLGDDRREQLLALGQLAAQVGRYCRPLDSVLQLTAEDVSAICTRVRRQPARNLEESRKGLFYTELLTTWKTC